MAVKKRFPYRTACVYCSGGTRANKKMDYQAETCEAAMQLCEGGPLECSYGCLGCGSCVQACKFDAIHINAFGVAEVDEDKCINCGACIRKCPRKLIRSRLQANCMVPLCSNQDKGADARKQCGVSCIACRLCEKKCPAGAIAVADNHAVIDDEKCLACGACVTVCPRHVIVDKDGVVLA